MASLEEMMPELAGVLAAQESALETVVATLTTHVRALLAANEQQAQRVQQLEAQQSEAREAMAELQRAAQASHAEAAALAESQRRVEQELLSVHKESRLALDRAVATAEALGGDIMKRLETYVDGRLASAVSSSSEQSLDEGARDRLDLLEKKFDYLSRVKMEIKELTRKVETQEKSIDGMKIGLEILSKSIGVDDANSDGDDDDDENDAENDSDSDMSDVQLPMNEVFGARSPSEPANMALSLDRLRESPRSQVERVPSDRLLDEKVRNMAVPHAQVKRLAQRRSFTLDVRHALEIKEAHRSALTSRGANPGRRMTSPQAAQPVSKAPVLLEEDPCPSSHEDGHEEEEDKPVEVADRPESDRAASDPQPDVSEDEAVVPEPPPPVPSTAPETQEADRPAEEDQESPKEVTAEPSPSPEPPILEHEEQSPVTPIAEEPVSPTPPEFGSEQLGSGNGTLVSATARSSVIPEEGESSEVDVDSDRPADIPVEYRERALSHQREFEDNLALFHPESTSSSAASTSRSGLQSTSRAVLIPSASAVFRSRRQERNARRQTLLTRKSVAHLEALNTTGRSTLTESDKKETWRRIFAKLVQLRRLHMLSGASPEKSMFRKQNASVGARVRRLEETAIDLEKAIELLETNIQTNAQGVETLDQMLSQFHLTTSSSVQTLALEQKAQSKALLAMDERFEVLDQEVGRMRSSNRRNSVQSSGANVMAAMSVQVQQLSARLDEQLKLLQATEAMANRLATTDLPAVQERADESLSSFRVDMERRLKEWVADNRRSLDALNATITETNRSLSVKMVGSIHFLYEDVLAITSAMFRGAELVHEIGSPDSASLHTAARARRSFDTGIKMAETILTKFAAACNSLSRSSDSPDALLVAEQAMTFVDELQKLQAQADKAIPLLVTPSDSASNNTPQASASSSANATSKGFEEYLIQETAKYIKTLENLLAEHEKTSSLEDNPDEADSQRQGETDPADEELMLRARDAVIQLRAVLSLLRSCRSASDEHQELQELQTAQRTMSQDLTTHSFAISQVGSTLALVKLMSTRLDSFMELSFSFARDDDVKKTVQELMSTSSSMRDKLAKQLEDAQREAAQRDTMLERDLNQLISRVNKKLDKDELLWTQEVLERQLQSVAKASLGEEDLVAIHRLLQHKLDKTQFNALLDDQRAKMAGGSTEIIDWLSGGRAGGSAAGSGPLVGAKCISCQGELPPSKAMIKTVVKQEVQHEMAKAKTQHQVAALAQSAASTGFRASNHRNMEKFKTELLLSSLQKQAKK